MVAGQEADQLEAEIAEVCGVINAATARLVELLGRVMETGAWEGEGFRSVEHWITWRCGLSYRRARSLVAMARRLGELPEIAAAFSSGELSAEQVGVVCRHAPAHVDAQVAELARHASVEQLNRMLSGYGFTRPLPSEGSEPENEEQSKVEPEVVRRVSFGYDEDGSWRLFARLRSEEGALVESALSSAREELFSQAEHPEGNRPSVSDVSWSDALVAMAERSLHECARIGSSAPRHLVLIHLNVDRTGSYGARLHLGPGLPESLRRQLGCDADVRAVFESAGKALSVGRTQRIVPKRTRIAVEHRDGGCRVPGCLRRRWLQVHHICHWEDGGSTDTSNLVTLCSHHHRLHHRGALGVEGDADDPEGVIFTNERGGRIEACGRPAPPPSLEAGVGNLGLGLGQARWVHPEGERLDMRWVHFDERDRLAG